MRTVLPIICGSPLNVRCQNSYPRRTTLTGPCPKSDSSKPRPARKDLHHRKNWPLDQSGQCHCVRRSDSERSMSWRLRSVTALALLAVVLSAAQNRSASAKPGKPVLRTVMDVPMPGPPVRFDYQSLDPTTGRLYIAHMNADQLVVFDTTSRKVIANLDGFARVHGVWAVPELGRVYAS